MILSKQEKYALHKSVLIECDFKSSTKCKGIYKKIYKNILKCRENNNGKDRCIYCFNTSTKTGKDNYNFIYNKDENYFENIDSELKAYLLGFIAGDGCIKKDGLALENHILDIEVLDLFKNNISPDSEYHKHSDPIRGENTICLKIFSMKIVKDLLKHLKLKSHGKKSDKISLPDLSVDLQWHFIRGLFDSDGSIISPLAKSKNPVCSICSTSSQMIDDLKKICNDNNIKYFYSESNHSIMFCGKNCLSFLNKIYENSIYFLNRKHLLYKIWSSWKPGFGTFVRPRKVREYYPSISEEHKEKIRESNRKRKGIEYVGN